MPNNQGEVASNPATWSPPGANRDDEGPPSAVPEVLYEASLTLHEEPAQRTCARQHSLLPLPSLLPLRQIPQALRRGEGRPARQHHNQRQCQRCCSESASPGGCCWGWRPLDVLLLWAPFHACLRVCQELGGSCRRGRHLAGGP